MNIKTCQAGLPPNQELVRRIILQRRRSRRTLEQFVQMRSAHHKRERYRRRLRVSHFLSTRIPKRLQLEHVVAPRNAARTVSTNWNRLIDWMPCEMDCKNWVSPRSRPFKPLPSPLLAKHSHSLIAAPTGTGKTMSYLLPIIQKIKAEERRRGISKTISPCHHHGAQS